jgi:uncharacterized RDD family membrane protein YckC
MSRHVVLTTAEGVELEYTLAGLGSRFLATVVDTVIQLLLVAAILLIAWQSVAHFLAGWSVWVIALTVLCLFAIVDGYYVFFETLWSGQTPGKRSAGLRVLRDDGFPLDFRSAMIRNAMRMVDFLPAFYAVGAASILLHHTHRRIGDIVAATLVVREREEASRDVGPSAFSWQGEAVVDMPLPLHLLTPQHVDLAETFLRRRGQLAPDLRARMAADVAARLRAQMQVPPEGDPESFLESVVRALARRAGL